MAANQRQRSRRNFSSSTLSSTWSSTSKLVRESLPWVLHGHVLKPQPEIRRSEDQIPHSPRTQARKRRRLGLKLALLKTRRKKKTKEHVPSEAGHLDLRASMPQPAGHISSKEERIRELLNEIDLAIIEVDRLLDEFVLDNGLHRSPIFPIANLFCKDRDTVDTLCEDDALHPRDISTEKVPPSRDSIQHGVEPMGRMAFEGQQRWTVRLVEPDLTVWEDSDTIDIDTYQVRGHGEMGTAIVYGKQRDDTVGCLMQPLEEGCANVPSPSPRRRNVLRKKQQP